MSIIKGGEALDFLVENAYAKINLYLDIVRKRSDGYHDILSVMQSVSLCDKIKLRKNDFSDIVVSSSSDKLPSDPKQNLVYRAASLFFEKAGKRDCGLTIEIEKNIPVSAGLAGGSSDAAATLRALNKIYGHPFTVEELCAMGGLIGADVPFCIVGGAKKTEGIGDKLAEIKGLPKCYIVIAIDKHSGTSTPAAYKALDCKFNDFNNYESGKDFDELVSAMNFSDITNLSKCSFNIFEEVLTENGSVDLIKAELNSSGALVSMMSGSGPSVFGIFFNKEEAKEACKRLSAIDITANIFEPISHIEI